MTAAHPEQLAFLQAIRTSPEDDTARLVFADWLDENGSPERAAFVRVQCELAGLDPCRRWKVAGAYCGIPCRACYLRRRERELWGERLPDGYTRGYHWFTAELGFSAQLADDRILTPGGNPPSTPRAFVSRGFVAAVRLTTAAFLGGGECGTCGGVGRAYSVRPRRPPLLCPACRGTGTVPGLAGSIAAAHPVTEWRLTDLEPVGPIAGGPHRGEWFLTRRDMGEELWRACYPDTTEHMATTPSLPSPQAVRDWLSARLVAYARRLAGLPPVQRKEPGKAC